MKYIVDNTWLPTDLDASLRDRFNAAHRIVPTTPGRAVILVLAESPAFTGALFSAAGRGLTEDNLMASNGLCQHLVHTIKGNIATIHPYYDGIVGIFSRDTGYRRSMQSIKRTACHEAMHMARFIAQRTLGLPYVEPVMNLEFEETMADWTGRLSQEFLDSLHLLTDKP